jgi:hypothetical protein
VGTLMGKRFIWLASYPRSGSNYLRYCIEQIYGLKTFSRYTNDPYDDAFNDGASSVANADHIRATQYPYYAVKTHGHDLEVATRDPAILLVRDGRDAICSHAHYDLECGYTRNTNLKYETVLKALIEGRLKRFDGKCWDWGAHARAWTQRQTPLTVIKFEFLIREPIEALKIAFNEISVNFEPIKKIELETFDELKRRDAMLFRNGIKRVYRKEMPKDMQVLFWERNGDMMRRFDYKP